MRIVDRVVVTVIVREVDGGRVVGELKSDPVTVFGVEGLVDFAEKLPSMLEDSGGK